MLQVQLACQLSAELDLCRLAPDAVAAALLVLVARAEGRRLPIAVAGRTVSRVCRANSPSYSSVVGQVHELEELWQVRQGGGEAGWQGGVRVSCAELLLGWLA